MTFNTLTVGAAVTPTVVKTYVAHYTNRKTRHQRPTAHISYDEGLHLIRSFLDFASHKTVEELQAFTSQWVPTPGWVRVENITIPPELVQKAAEILGKQLGPDGIIKVGGSKWWQWRQNGADLKAEWVEMWSHYNERRKNHEETRRVMLYVHGGAYFFGSVDEHRYQIQRHARKLKAKVLAPRYRLAPQFPFPCGLHDCLATYLYLLSQHDPTEIILAGDSAGAGMVVSVLCTLRDQGLPLPAGAVLISPWVDLTHSFPSLGGTGDFDYIPAHGFMQKPSASWPPPNDDEVAALSKNDKVNLSNPEFGGKAAVDGPGSIHAEAVQGFAVINKSGNGTRVGDSDKPNDGQPGTRHSEVMDAKPGPEHPVSIQIDGNLVVLKDQIQMYATNQLISHPLVSPVLQPSLGGLPPLLIMTGGGELLRDEQIYLAHKAANPTKYPLGDRYRQEYDPADAILKKYKPTPVQLQVWDDLCHVAPTLSFTRPAKFMYRSIAQFGAWALARAQKTSIEIVADDDISVISSGSETDSDADPNESMESLAKQKKIVQGDLSGQIGKAGSPLPHFKNHMVRQRVDRNGNYFPLTPAHELPALQMDKNDVGVIKPGPVRKWMAAKQEWDTKYARKKRAVQKLRLKEMSASGGIDVASGERPPPSALAGRRFRQQEFARKKKSMGLTMWSLWGSKHDESTIKREEEVIEKEEKERQMSVVDPAKGPDGIFVEPPTRQSGESARRRKFSQQPANDESNGVSRSRSRRRTITVTDIGQTGDSSTEQHPDIPLPSSDEAGPSTSMPNTHLTPLFVPRFKNLHHLRSDTAASRPDDTSSIRTGQSALTGDIESLRNASTTAVFSAPGVVRDRAVTNASSLITNDEAYTNMDGGNDSEATSLFSGLDSGTGMRSAGGAPLGGTDTPSSRRSLERLMSNQVHMPEEEGGDPLARLQALRSPSTVAVVAAEGVVGVVEGSREDNTADEIVGKEREETRQVEDMAHDVQEHEAPEDTDTDTDKKRPALYEREDSVFKTAAERL